MYGSLVMPKVRVLQVMQRVLPSLVMPTVRVLLVMVFLMPTALYWVVAANGESAAGDAMVDGVPGDALTVRVLQGTLRLTVPLLQTTVMVLVVGGRRRFWRRAWWVLLVGWFAGPGSVCHLWRLGGSSPGGGCRWGC